MYGLLLHVFRWRHVGPPLHDEWSLRLSVDGLRQSILALLGVGAAILLVLGLAREDAVKVTGDGATLGGESGPPTPRTARTRRAPGPAPGTERAVEPLAEPETDPLGFTQTGSVVCRVDGVGGSDGRFMVLSAEGPFTDGPVSISGGKARVEADGGAVVVTFPADAQSGEAWILLPEAGPVEVTWQGLVPGGEVACSGVRARTGATALHGRLDGSHPARVSGCGAEVETLEDGSWWMDVLPSPCELQACVTVDGWYICSGSWPVAPVPGAETEVEWPVRWTRAQRASPDGIRWAQDHGNGPSSACWRTAGGVARRCQRGTLRTSMPGLMSWPS